MKTLILADSEPKNLYEYYESEKLQDIDLITSCGDLRSEYFSFFITLPHVPLLYVRGSYDGQYSEGPPEGCIYIEDSIYRFRGIWIMGLGDSMEYIPGMDNQYTECQMVRRIRRMGGELRRNEGIDTLVSYALAFQLNDMEDLPHRGFSCFNRLIKEYESKYFVHGHVHTSYGRNLKWIDRLETTTAINACESYVIGCPNSRCIARNRGVLRKAVDRVKRRSML